jgi:hypothetical protein
VARAAYTETKGLKALRVLLTFAEGTETNLAALIRVGKAFAMAPVLAKLRNLTPSEIQTLKGNLRAFVRLLAGGVSTDHRGGGYLRVEIVPLKVGNDVSLLVDGEPLDVLLYQVATMLSAIGVERLRLCPATDCGRAFVKVGRREYCSPRCQRRVFLAGYDPFKAKPQRKDRYAKTTRTRRR